MYLDVNGLPQQANGDGGDKLGNVGFWNEGFTFNRTFPWPTGMAPFLYSLIKLSPNGPLLRDEIQYTNPNDVSRDQIAPVVRELGYQGKSSLEMHFLNGIFVDVLKNYSRYPNGDLALPQDYGRFIRSYHAWYLYPFLILSDFGILINSLLISFYLTRPPSFLRVWLASKVSWLWFLTNQFPPNAEGVPQNPLCPTNSTNDKNHIGDLQQAKTIYPTPVSFLARKIYKNFRPGGPELALTSYYTPTNGSNPEFAQLWIPTVQKF